MRFVAGDEDQADTLRRIWNESRHGLEAILFIEKPYSEPENGGLFFIKNKNFNLPYKGPLKRDVVLELVEQGGYPLSNES